MTIKELVKLLDALDDRLEVHVETPDGSSDFFVDGVRGYGRVNQVIIETSQRKGE